MQNAIVRIHIDYYLGRARAFDKFGLLVCQSGSRYGPNNNMTLGKLLSHNQFPPVSCDSLDSQYGDPCV